MQFYVDLNEQVPCFITASPCRGRLRRSISTPTVAVAVPLAFPDASAHRAPLYRPTPVPTALPSYWSHVAGVCTALAAHATARPPDHTPVHTNAQTSAYCPASGHRWRTRTRHSCVPSCTPLAGRSSASQWCQTIWTPSRTRCACGRRMWCRNKRAGSTFAAAVTLLQACFRVWDAAVERAVPLLPCSAPQPNSGWLHKLLG
eukprot:365289-Chlamydomonas_euryale.AAC.13